MSEQGNDTRRVMAVIVTVVIGLALGFIIKRVTIGLFLSGLVIKR